MQSRPRPRVGGGMRAPRRGQASVLAMFFLAVIVVAAISLFKSGRLVTDRMALQNAADAAAYSVSLVEARDLNFAAYMNRAMVVNEVAIGQMVGLASWAAHTRSFHDYIQTYDDAAPEPLSNVPIINIVFNPIHQVLDKTATAFRYTGLVLNSIVKPVAQVFAIVSHGANYAYGISQRVFHYASAVMAMGVVDDMVVRNGPPGTRVSDFGILALISHLATFTDAADQMARAPGLSFPGSYTKGYLPHSTCTEQEYRNKDPKCDDALGYERLAAIVGDSRDTFTRGRGWKLALFDMINAVSARLSSAGLPVPTLPTFVANGPDGSPHTYFGVQNRRLPGQIPSLPPPAPPTPAFPLPVRFNGTATGGMYYDLTRQGGNELRMVAQKPAGAATSAPYARALDDEHGGKHYNWSAADSTAVNGGLIAALNGHLEVQLPGYTPPCPPYVPPVRDPVTGAVIIPGFQPPPCPPPAIAPQWIVVPGSAVNCNGQAISNQLNFNCGTLGPFTIPIPIPPGQVTLQAIPLPQLTGVTFPTQAPLATAFAQVGQQNKNVLTAASAHMGTRGSPPATVPGIGYVSLSPFLSGSGSLPRSAGPVPMSTYGPPPKGVPGAWGVPGDINAWFGLPMSLAPTNPRYAREANGPDGGSTGIYNPLNPVNGSMVAWKSRRIAPYMGLAPYMDTTEKVSPSHAIGPYIVIGVELRQEDRRVAPSPPTGRFALDDEAAGAQPEIATLAKAQVYFKRPNEVPYFERGDGYEERGSTFNPYWQARLVETSHAERVFALALQQGLVVPGSTGPAQAVDNTLGNVARTLRAATCPAGAPPPCPP